MMEGMEFEINFTDRTMLEGNGEFLSVQEIMNRPQKVAGGMIVDVPSKIWTIKSNVTVLHAIGFAIVQCDFYHDGKIVVTSFKPSAKDIYIPDIRCLTAWAQAYGWNIPEPSPTVIDSWKDFWKMQWETHIVDSEYLEKKYGERTPLIIGDEEDDDNDFIDFMDDDGDLEKYRKK